MIERCTSKAALSLSIALIGFGYAFCLAQFAGLIG